MNDPVNINLSQVRQGPIRNKTLSPELLDQIKAAFDVVGKYLGMTLRATVKPSFRRTKFA